MEPPPPTLLSGVGATDLGVVSQRVTDYYTGDSTTVVEERREQGIGPEWTAVLDGGTGVPSRPGSGRPDGTGTTRPTRPDHGRRSRCLPCGDEGCV